jgi:LPS export ABC transporter protein LptC
MIYRKLIFVIVLLNLFLLVLCVFSYGQESGQQIADFSLAGYGEQGKKTWDISGESADIFQDSVKLNNVTGNVYGKDEDIRLTADKGDYDKKDGKVHLEDNVVVTTSAGAKLTTDSLDWDRNAKIISTNDLVNIERDNIMAVALGATGEPDLKKVALEKDVKLDINPRQEDGLNEYGVKEKITVTCDGPLEIDYQNNIASFKNNVVVKRQDSTIYSDKIDVFFAASGDDKIAKDKAQGFIGSKIDRIVAKGNVRVERGDNISYSEEAIYSSIDKKLVLTGNPRLIISSAEDIK